MGFEMLSHPGGTSTSSVVIAAKEGLLKMANMRATAIIAELTIKFKAISVFSPKPFEVSAGRQESEKLQSSLIAVGWQRILFIVEEVLPWPLMRRVWASGTTRAER